MIVPKDILQAQPPVGLCWLLLAHSGARVTPGVQGEHVTVVREAII